MSEPVWYYVADGQQAGPVDLETMREQIERGVIGPQTMVWRKGMADWVEAGRVGELFTVQPVYEPGAAAAAYDTGGSGRPTPVTVFGILNIVFGGLGVICTPISIAFTFLPASEGQAFMGPEMRVFSLVGGIVGIIAGLVLVAAGIGLLNLRAWARKVSYGYGWFAVIWGVVSFGVNMYLMLPKMDRAPEVVGGVIGGMCGGMVGLIYPVLLIVFMRKPRVVEACYK